GNTVTSTLITEYVEGTIGRSNEKGFTLSGRDGWLNLSRYADPAPSIPVEGTGVRVGLDKAGFVRTIELLAGAASPWEGSGQSTPVDRDLRILRQAVLNTATAILSSGGRSVSTEDVLAVAEQLEQWVLR